MTTNEIVPESVRQVSFDFDWDDKKVWALNESVQWMDVADLTWHFDIPFLNENGQYNLTPREVIDNPGAHQAEYYRTMEVDLIHPIDVMENKGRVVILDGLHRLMKTYINGRDKVPVRIIPRSRIPEILK